MGSGGSHHGCMEVKSQSLNRIKAYWKGEDRLWRLWKQWQAAREWGSQESNTKRGKAQFYCGILNGCELILVLDYDQNLTQLESGKFRIATKKQVLEL